MNLGLIFSTLFLGMLLIVSLNLTASTAFAIQGGIPDGGNSASAPSPNDQALANACASTAGNPSQPLFCITEPPPPVDSDGDGRPDDIDQCPFDPDDACILGPPQVISFGVSPEIVSLSAPGGPTVTITAQITSQVGIEHAGIFIQDDCDCSGFPYTPLPLQLVSGTPQNGVWQTTYTFPSQFPPQYYQMAGLAYDFDYDPDAGVEAGHIVGFPLRFIQVVP
jgi:hypothetical protein